MGNDYFWSWITILAMLYDRFFSFLKLYFEWNRQIKMRVQELDVGLSIGLGLGSSQR